jgi:Ca-activated chloride channel homolog
MKRRLPIFLTAFAGAVVLLAQDYTIRSDVRLVLLDVSVQNRHGAFITDLPRASFTVLENGRPQQLTAFEHTDVPVTVGILVDESISMEPKRAQVLAAARSFIAASNRQDEIFVINFNDRVQRGLPPGTRFSDNISELSAALFRGVSEGRTALYDAVLAGLDELESGHCQRKALVVISDGADNASVHSRREMLDRVAGSLATVYAVGLFDREANDSDPGVLHKLSQISGGVAYFPREQEQMLPVCREIARNIRSRYTLGYVPQAASNAEALRRIQVKVQAANYSGLTARARSSYRYAEIGK